MAISAALGVAMPSVAYAQGAQADEAKMDEAKQLFTKGSDLYLAKRFAEALEALQASYKLVPSPNSGLLIARCLHALGKPVEALEMYRNVENDARRRVADGEVKYGRAAGSAAVEGAEIRATLGSLRIHVTSPAAGATLLVDGAPSQVGADGVAVVWHVPGEARVTYQPPGEPEQKHVVTVPPGGEVQLEFNGPAIVPPVVRPGPASKMEEGTPQPGARVAWAKPAAWAAGAVTLAGAGVFAGFGIASQSEYHDLLTLCGQTHSCGPMQQAEANDGKRNQLIADVGLAVGAVAAAATVTFVIVAASSGTQPVSGPAVRVTFGFGSAGVEVPW